MKLFLHSLIAAFTSVFLISHTDGAGVQTPSGDLFLKSSDGSFYGTSAEGGTFGFGTVFRVTPDNEVTVLVNFTGNTGAAIGAHPKGGLVEGSDGNLWGTTEQGGTTGNGTVFKLNPSSGTFQTVVQFDGNNDGGTPTGSLVKGAGDSLWGMTSEGGASDAGVIFMVDAITGGFSPVVSFTGSTGAAKGSGPKGSLYYDGAGTFWGLTSAGGATSVGTVFKYTFPGDVFTTVAEFTGPSGGIPGAMPVASLVSDGAGSLWGTTSGGGTNSRGTIFKVNTTNDAFTSVHAFDGTKGSSPRGSLLNDGLGSMWGTTAADGEDLLGTVFKINTTTNVLTTVFSFTGTSGNARGAFPLAGLTNDNTGTFWGTASFGGREDRGTIFRIDASTGEFELMAEPNESATPPATTVQSPPTTGTDGSPIVLTGTTSDNNEVLSVLVNVNGTGYLPATITPGAAPGDPSTWTFSFIPAPAPAQNIILIKSVDSGGDTSKVTTLKFKYTPVRAEAGTYNGLVTPTVNSSTLFQHTGFFSMKVLPNGRFTGKLMLGGQSRTFSMSGNVSTLGNVTFGKLQTPTLTIVRKNLPSLVLSLTFTITPSLTAQISGTLTESGTPMATLAAGEALYSLLRNPVAPEMKVPATLLNPNTDRGVYTGVFPALTPIAQGIAATDYPQGSGYAFIKLVKNGKMRFAGKLADGKPFGAAAVLTEGNVFPLYSKITGSLGAIAGNITFQDNAGSDADATGIKWFRIANARLPYPNGWPNGIEIDFLGSKYVPVKLLPGQTPMGNPLSIADDNALLTLTHTGLAGDFTNELAINSNGAVLVLDTTPGGTATPALKVKLSNKGAFTGSYLDPISLKTTKFNGVVLQKAETAAGFFITLTPSGSPATPGVSGSVEIVAQ